LFPRLFSKTIFHPEAVPGKNYFLFPSYNNADDDNWL